MFRAIHKSVVRLLIANIAIVGGVSEGLHHIPGCGHGVEVGNRVFLLAISLPEHTQPTDGRPRVERPVGQDIPIYDEDLCPICSVVGQSCTSGDCVQFVLVMPLVHDLPAIVLDDAPAATVRLFQVRAPPLV